jgi:hypothetical protein
MPAHRIDPELRFLDAIEFDTNGGCWLWSKGVSATGYGTLWIKGRNVSAHRYSWEREKGSIDDAPGYHGLCVLHRCDVRACVNPDHLFLGTVADNNADRGAKGRTAVVRGEDRASAKLSKQQVDQIKRLRGTLPQRSIARKFGVSQGLVSLIQTGKVWAA